MSERSERTRRHADDRAERRREQLEERERRRDERLAERAADRAQRQSERAAERAERQAERADERAERATERQVRRLDRSALQGLAHPLRVQLYDALVVEGSATASELGRRLGESSGATSYHLRQLERHGFVETDPDRGTGRERWWRATREDTQLRGVDFEGDPAAMEAHRLVSSEWQRTRQTRYEHWRATRGQWPLEWRETGGDTTSHLHLDASEATELFEEINGVLQRWADAVRVREDDQDPDPAVRPVEVQLSIFPNGAPPPAAES